MFPGYASRIDKELKKIYTENTLKLAKEKKIKIPINIKDTPRRKYSVFIGATILSNTYNGPQYDQYWITKKDWDESGPNIILKKCQNILR
jgi:actin-related protein 2